MTMVYLELDSLAKIDEGLVAAMFRKAAREVILDCEDRPALAVARSVSLKMSMKPVTNEEGRCDGIRVFFDVNSSLPKRQTNGTDLVVKAGGKAAFHIEDDPVEEEVDDEAA